MIHMTFILSKRFSPLHYSACHQTVCISAEPTLNPSRKFCENQADSFCICFLQTDRQTLEAEGGNISLQDIKVLRRHVNFSLHFNMSIKPFLSFLHALRVVVKLFEKYETC